jgi:hypothetical protein
VTGHQAPVAGCPSLMAAAPTRRSKQARSCPDWHAIEREYRAGGMSLRQLAAKHRCSHSTIANKARRDGWLRGHATTCGCAPPAGPDG